MCLEGYTWLLSPYCVTSKESTVSVFLVSALSMTGDSLGMIQISTARHQVCYRRVLYCFLIARHGVNMENSLLDKFCRPCFVGRWVVFMRFVYVFGQRHSIHLLTQWDIVSFTVCYILTSTTLLQGNCKYHLKFLYNKEYQPHLSHLIWKTCPTTVRQMPLLW